MSIGSPVETKLATVLQPQIQAHPGHSGVVMLSDGRDAFAARVLLADAAERTLDLQYYIWHADLSGTLLFGAVHRAADRGVRVRLLLDDNATAGLDATLAALDAHPNIEVRLFNAFVHRRVRVLGYLTDFSRLNRRMHNKSFTVDNEVTIVGGRNVGDEYFGADQELSFVDLDVLAVGPVVQDVSADFDRYWECASSCPVARVIRVPKPESLAALSALCARAEHDPDAQAYVEAVARRPFVQELLAGDLALEWVPVRLVSDDPAKGLDRVSRKELLAVRLRRIIDSPAAELDLISAYFVPGRHATESFAGLARGGVRVSVLTNSLEATDVAAVHAGYARRRKPLLAAGVTLFELKRTGAERGARDRVFGGSSGSSLHTKTFSVDRLRLFVGSFNFDPRSTRLNTEMGFIIESAKLAGGTADAFINGIPDRAYTVRLNQSGALEWVERVDGREIVYDRDPKTSIWLRAAVQLLSLLPIDWLL
ncbi:MAG: phospholipase D family protein [Gemmatimonadaceae bacterium]